jgi:ankyrin repeat protein
MEFVKEGLIIAAREGNLAQVEKLVLTQNHSVDTVSNKYKVTALHAASLHGHTTVGN